MNSACTVDLMERGQLPRALASGFWHVSQEISHEKAFGSLCMPRIPSFTFFLVSTTSISDPWSIEQSIRDAVVTVSTAANKILVRDLGWTREQAIETRLRLRAFEEDWDAPGMEIYDEL